MGFPWASHRVDIPSSPMGPMWDSHEVPMKGVPTYPLKKTSNKYCCASSHSEASGPFKAFPRCIALCVVLCAIAVPSSISRNVELAADYRLLATSLSQGLCVGSPLGHPADYSTSSSSRTCQKLPAPSPLRGSRNTAGTVPHFVRRYGVPRAGTSRVLRRGCFHTITGTSSGHRPCRNTPSTGSKPKPRSRRLPRQSPATSHRTVAPVPTLSQSLSQPLHIYLRPPPSRYGHPPVWKPLLSIFFSVVHLLVIDNEHNYYYSCAEQPMLSEKVGRFSDVATHQKVMASTEPVQQKSPGHTVSHFIEGLWDQQLPSSDDIVFQGNRIKFSFRHLTSATRGHRRQNPRRSQPVRPCLGHRFQGDIVVRVRCQFDPPRSRHIGETSS